MEAVAERIAPGRGRSRGASTRSSANARRGDGSCHSSPRQLDTIRAVPARPRPDHAAATREPDRARDAGVPAQPVVRVDGARRASGRSARPRRTTTSRRPKRPGPHRRSATTSRSSTATPRTSSRSTRRCPATTTSSWRSRRCPRGSARCSDPARTPRAGRTTASRWRSRRASAAAIRATSWRSSCSRSGASAAFIVGISLHTQGMTYEEAVQLFEERCYMAPVNAEREARRGTMDPTYLVYTLGKWRILELRDEVRRRLGARFHAAAVPRRVPAPGDLAAPRPANGHCSTTSGSRVPRPPSRPPRTERPPLDRVFTPETHIRPNPEGGSGGLTPSGASRHPNCVSSLARFDGAFDDPVGDRVESKSVTVDTMDGFDPPTPRGLGGFSMMYRARRLGLVLLAAVMAVTTMTVEAESRTRRSKTSIHRTAKSTKVVRRKKTAPGRRTRAHLRSPGARASAGFPDDRQPAAHRDAGLRRARDRGLRDRKSAGGCLGARSRLRSHRGGAPRNPAPRRRRCATARDAPCPRPRARGAA